MMSSRITFESIKKDKRDISSADEKRKKLIQLPKKNNIETGFE